MTSTERTPYQNFNEEIVKMAESGQTDYYYHLGFDSKMDLKAAFGDVKVVIMCGSPKRAKIIANRAIQLLEVKLPFGTNLATIGKNERYHIYKVGPLLVTSHGMGRPSVGILLHEVTKLMKAAGVEDPIYIRVGTCGGVGLKPGTCVVSTGAWNGGLSANFPLIRFGKTLYREAIFDQKLAKTIYSLAGKLPAATGITMAADCFYEGQGRLDGAICHHTLDDKFNFLKKLHRLGVVNIEMEGDQLASFCHHTGIRSAMICTVIVNRLLGDQVDVKPKTMEEWNMRSIDLALRFVRTQMGLKPVNEEVEKEPALKKNTDLINIRSKL
eukprot:TRINITY_DN559_c0_g1_i1.p1 TRINITY_DN559_c0_g1~~TRINITY_DN559_c0_g1_i1.p1  ORF type:complete len:352 (-),score=72.14 TRINITY_DN559_c0_g1_i1:381-1358(-)